MKIKGELKTKGEHSLIMRCVRFKGETRQNVKDEIEGEIMQNVKGEIEGETKKVRLRKKKRVKIKV